MTDAAERADLIRRLREAANHEYTDDDLLLEAATMLERDAEPQVTEAMVEAAFVRMNGENTAHYNPAQLAAARDHARLVCRAVLGALAARSTTQ